MTSVLTKSNNITYQNIRIKTIGEQLTVQLPFDYIKRYSKPISLFV